MEWFFPPNEYGQDSGFHDAGVETFKGNLNHYLVREVLQNSIDAQKDLTRPVHVSFAKVNLGINQIPGADDLRARMDACGEYWPHNKQLTRFFQNAALLLSQKDVVALKISDFNTTGVLGSDIDRDSGWYSLVKCSGASSKGGAEGGSFGIGKNSPFAVSQFRSILYSTLNTDEEHVFQGVARLVTHNDSSGKKLQATGYLGGTYGASVRELKYIPRVFRRTEPGTDIWVLGYSVGDQWAKEITFSVLENFWPAIMRDKLIVEVAGTSINSSTLPALLELFSAEGEFSAHMFYAATVNPTYSHGEKIRNLGDVNLSLADGNPSLPKKIAMVRKTGMVIFHKQFRSVVPFAGLFYCGDENGNRLLRESETPRHDTWDPDRPEPRASRKLLETLNDWIRDKIKEMKVVEPAKVTEIPELYKWLPDDEAAMEKGAEPEEQKDTRESPERSPNREPVVVRPLAPRLQATEPGSHANEGSNNFNSGGTEEGEQVGDGGPGSGTNEGGDGTGGKGPGPGHLREGGGAGAVEEGTGGPKPPIPIQSRIFLAEPATSTYRIVMDPLQTAVATLRIGAVGDDATIVPMRVLEAWLDDGTKLGLDADGMVIQGLSLQKAQATKMWARVDAEDRLSLEVSAHEA